MPSIKGDTKRGPDSLVTPTNAAGFANSDAAPTITDSPISAKPTLAHQRDIQIQTLAMLRVLARLIAEQNYFERGINDDVDAMFEDEMISLGTDALS